MALVAGHGPFTWGKTPEKAVHNMVVLEELAKMALFTLAINPNRRALSRRLSTNITGVNTAATPITDNNNLFRIRSQTHEHRLGFNSLDWLVIVLFLIGMVTVVWASMRKKVNPARTTSSQAETPDGFQIGTSIYSSNIGSEHLVGLAGAGFATVLPWPTGKSRHGSS